MNKPRDFVPNDRNIPGLGPGGFREEIQQFFGTFFTALAFVVMVLPFMRHLGFSSGEAFEQLLPLHQTCAARTNSIFLYLAGCVVFCLSGILYHVFFLKRFCPMKSTLAVESVVSMVILVGVWMTPSAMMRLVLLAGRFCVCVPVYARLHLPERSVPAVNILAGVVSGFVAIGFIMRYIIPSVPHVSWGGQPMFLEFVLLGCGTVMGAILQNRLGKGLIWALDAVVLLGMVALVVRREMSYFDYSAFLGAVNDLRLGKDILANVVVSYGFLNVYFTAAVFELFRVSDYYLGLSVLIGLSYVAVYGAVYVFLRWYSRDFVFSVLFWAMIVYIDFFCLHIPIHWLPQSTYLRFGSFLPVFFGLVFLARENPRISVFTEQDQKAETSPQKLASVRREWLFAVITALCIFWVPEYGMYILAALFAVGLSRFLFLGTRDVLFWGKRLFRVLICVVTIGVGGGLYIGWKYHQPPLWGDLFFFQRIYASSGLAMNQLQGPGVWSLVVVVYVVAIYAVWKFYGSTRFSRNPQDKEGGHPGRAANKCSDLAEGFSSPRGISPWFRYSDAWLFLSFFGILFLLYFIGKGGGFVLARVVLPALLLVGAFLGHLLRTFGHGNSFAEGGTPEDSQPHAGGWDVRRILVYSVVFVGFFMASVLIQKEGKNISLAAIVKGNYQKWRREYQVPPLARFLKGNKNYSKFILDVQVMDRLVPNGHPAAILSKNDTLYYIHARRPALFNNAFYAHFLNKPQLAAMSRQILSSGAQYVFVDNSDFQCYDNLVTNHNQDVLEQIMPRFVRKTSLGFLDVYERVP